MELIETNVCLSRFAQLLSFLLKSFSLLILSITYCSIALTLAFKAFPIGQLRITQSIRTVY